jgi:23S rRNA (uridine2552-2'-O)-methyltransferase
MSGGGKKGRSGGGGKSASGAGPRKLAVRLKTAKGRTTSSQLWLSRQLNDPYVAQARREGYRSRAVYKLLQVHERYKILRPGQRVIDLGAAPGGWSQASARLVKAGEPGGGHVIAIDIAAMEPIIDVAILELDFMADSAPDRLKALLGGHKADVVLSDMAAPATGHRPTDHSRIMGLCEAAVAFAEEVLAPGGVFLAKVLQGGTERALLDQLKSSFTTVRHVKPEASRADSAELYVLATGFRG